MEKPAACGGAGIDLKEEEIAIGVDRFEETWVEVVGIVLPAVEEEGHGTVESGGDLEDGGPEEGAGVDAGGAELLGEDAAGDEGEEAEHDEYDIAELGVLVDPDAEEGAGGEEEAAEGAVGGEKGPPFGEVARGEEAGGGALDEPELVGEGEGAEGAAAEAEAAEVAGEEGGREDGKDVVRQREQQLRATRIGVVAGRLVHLQTVVRRTRVFSLLVFSLRLELERGRERDGEIFHT